MREASLQIVVIWRPGARVRSSRPEWRLRQPIRS